ncbi:GNAT family N-acetyltransferase [Nocardioides massiliensis]|uniref:GNAT superfamily N-acetyltransferase n=1 Tax=Nocardioides massiliensis TaxID=1325935 RepID=A0ABT9NP40_9ACTN|nr:GNAT family N-acetyltransferase [Nocardioides massiliensis]MDP9822163.1 GNAT superfamily N-acetyltransferase [Nocardioides massiliensis]
MRTTLEDRPGALARLAQSCGDHGANILALQIFPGLEGVTDELVLSTPAGWAPDYVAALVTRAGGRDVIVRTAPERALVDEPTRYLQAARQVQEGLVPVEEVLAHLLEATPVHEGQGDDPHDDGSTLVVEAGGIAVRLRRAEEFTATEHARAAALAAVADAAEAVRTPDPVPGEVDAARLVLRAATLADHPALQRMHARCSARTVYHRYGVPLLRLTDRLARHLTGGDAVLAVVAEPDGSEEVVGIVQVVRRGGGTTPELTVLVEDEWQRRGVGTRLTRAALAQLGTEGYREVVLRGQVDNPGLVPLVTRLGVRVRVRVAGDDVTVLLGIAGEVERLGTPASQDLVRG